MGKNVFQKIAESRGAGGGNFIKDGKGRLIVKSITMPNLYEGDTFIAEFVVKASQPTEVDEKTGQPVQPNAPGSSCSYVQQLEKFESAAGNVKGFVIKLDGDDTLEDDGDRFIDHLKTVCNVDPKARDDKGNLIPVNPCRGFEIEYETYRKPIRKGANVGKMITLPKWTHVELTAEQVEANKALLDGR